MDSVSDTASSSSRPTSPTPQTPISKAYRFQWDVAQNRPGPGSVISEGTDARGDYFSSQPVRADLYLNTSSTTLALGALPSEWSSSRHGFNAREAISTVLNNPHKSQAPPKAHSHLPGAPPVDLPRVKRKDFDAYLRSIAPEWERYQASSQLGREGAAQLDSFQSDEPAPMLSTSSSTTSLSSLPTTPITPRTPRAVPPSQREVPPLETVSSVFFQSSFDLSDPRTFAAVTELSSDSKQDPTALVDSIPLLERLSQHADTVEQHLVREIAARSSSFFAALTNLQDLQTESVQCLSRIAHLRTRLQEIDDDSAKRGLEIVRQEWKVDNVHRIQEGLQVISKTVETTAAARGLLNNGRWAEVLTVVSGMENLWNAQQELQPLESLGYPPPFRLDSMLSSVVEESEHSHSTRSSVLHALPIPLSSLTAFSELPSHLRALTVEIATSLSSELVACLQTDLHSRIDEDLASPEAQTNITKSLQEQLPALLDGLVKTKSVKEAFTKWRAVALEQVKAIMQRYLEFFDPDVGDAESSQKLQETLHSNFIATLRLIYASLNRFIQGLQTQNSVIISLLESSSLTEAPALQDDLEDVLITAAERANALVAKAFSVRSEQHTLLELPDFARLFADAWTFVVHCEVLCRRMIVGLRGVLINQAKAFLQSFHQNRLTRSAKLVEDELWNPVDVPPDIQHLADALVDAAVRDPPELDIPNGGTAPTAPGIPINPALNKHLRIEDRAYFAVGATLTVLSLLTDYARLVRALPTLTTDTMSRVIEFLKAFNSRTCQVVLGAGAMRSAGLKNITAKHLALASQSLAIMITLVPYVREMFRRHLNPKQAVMLVEFDKLKRDYQEHQDEIHSKLIAIMGDRLSAHIRSLQAIDWNEPARPGGAPNDYMELLIKETVTLHKVLSRYLPLPTVEFVMSQVFASINHRLAEEYGEIELPTQQAKERLLADARYLHEKLSTLKHVRMPTNMLETVVSESRVMPPRSPSPVPPSVLLAQQQQQSQQQWQQENAPFSQPQQQRASPTLAPTPGSTANARIKGMFARVTRAHQAAATLADVKRAPTPPEKLPAPPETDSELAQAPAAPPKPESISRRNSGFRQVEESEEARPPSALAEGANGTSFAPEPDAPSTAPAGDADATGAADASGPESSHEPQRATSPSPAAAVAEAS